MEVVLTSCLFISNSLREMAKDYDALKNVERIVIDHLHVKLPYAKQFTLQNCKRLPPG